MPYGTVSIQDLPVVSPDMKTLPTSYYQRPSTLFIESFSQRECHVIFGPPKYSVPLDQIFQESWNIWSGETDYFRYCLKYLVPHRNIWSPPISNHWRWYRQVLKVNGTSSSSHGLHHWLPVDSFDVYRMPEMVEGKKWGECTKCLRWYHTNKCLNISQKSLEGEWVCPKCLS